MCNTWWIYYLHDKFYTINSYIKHQVLLKTRECLTKSSAISSRYMTVPVEETQWSWPGRDQTTSMFLGKKSSSVHHETIYKNDSYLLALACRAWLDLLSVPYTCDPYRLSAWRLLGQCPSIPHLGKKVKKKKWSADEEGGDLRENRPREKKNCRLNINHLPTQHHRWGQIGCHIATNQNPCQIANVVMMSSCG